VLAVPLLRLRHTVDAATRAIRDLTDRTAPILGKADVTMDNVNTALGQVHTSLDGVNLQLQKVDTITGHAAHVSANVANLANVVTSVASNPLVKVAALGYGVRQATARRSRQEEERDVRALIREQRREQRAARRRAKA
jgi:ABC-type transporter Mla subunit MlaD